MEAWKIDLSEVIANGDAYTLEAPLPYYESLARKIQLSLGDKVKLKTHFGLKESQFWLTDRIALESVLISANNEEVYIYNNKMYAAEHSSGDERSIGYCYYGTLYPSFAVIVDGCEVGRTTEADAVVKMAVDAIICTLAKPKPKKPRIDPSMN